MKWFAGEFLAIIGIVVLARAVLLPLCGRFAIWHERLYGCNDFVEIGDARGRVARIGLLHTVLESKDVGPAGHRETVNNADVFRKVIVVGLSFRDWARLGHAK